jgi:hypothetical protein
MSPPDQQPPHPPSPSSAGYAKAAFSAIASTARTALRSVRLFAVAVTVAALWLWGWTLWPFGFAHWWSVALAILFLVFLLTPPAILWAFVIGLGQLANLPTELRGKTQDGRDLLARVGADLAGRTGVSRKRRSFRLGQSAYALWALILDSRGMLLQYAGMVRLANPIALAIGFAAGIAGALLLVFAGLTSLWWMAVNVRW